MSGFAQEFRIGNKLVGKGRRSFIIAELSANHRGSFRVASDTIKAIADCGADAVKIQTYTADTMTIDSERKYFRINRGTIWDGRKLYDLYKEAYTPWEWQPKLQKVASRCGLIFFSTPFDASSVDFLETLRVPAYKIASFEITDIPLIRRVAAKGKPVIISTGIARPEEIRDALDACRAAGNRTVALLKCTSAYPAPLAEVNLRAIASLRTKYKLPVGLSDHTLGMAAAVASCSFESCIIEKHFIINRKNGGPDAMFSMEPAEFKLMVLLIRQAEECLGDGKYRLTMKMKAARSFARSLFCVTNMAKGESFTRKNVRSIRPGYGLSPKFLSRVIGKKASRKIRAGEPLSWRWVTGGGHGPCRKKLK